MAAELSGRTARRGDALGNKNASNEYPGDGAACAHKYNPIRAQAAPSPADHCKNASGFVRHRPSHLNLQLLSAGGRCWKPATKRHGAVMPSGKDNNAPNEYPGH